MIGLYIFAGVIILAIAAFIFFKIKWSREDKMEKRTQNEGLKADKLKDNK